jgi:hypothetical protein
MRCSYFATLNWTSNKWLWYDMTVDELQLQTCTPRKSSCITIPNSLSDELTSDCLGVLGESLSNNRKRGYVLPDESDNSISPSSNVSAQSLVTTQVFPLFDFARRAYTMDPCSAIGGIVAFAQVITCAAKCANLFYEVSYKAGALEDEVRFYATHLAIFETLLAGAHVTIRDHYSHNNNSLVIKRFQDKQVFLALIGQTNHILRRVEGHKPQIRGQTMGFRSRVKWVAGKKAREETCSWMDRVQAQFHLLTELVRHEALIMRKETLSVKDKMIYDLKGELLAALFMVLWFFFFS